MMRKLKGTWEVTEVKNDSITLTNTGEKFTFFECKNELLDCDGIFKTSDGKEENIIWGVAKHTVFILDIRDTNLIVYKYNGNGNIIELSKKQFVFYNNGYQAGKIITLEK